MDGDGGQEVSFYFISHGKEKPPHHLGDGESMTPQMRQDKQKSTQDKGQDQAPSSEKAIDDSSKKDFFSYGCHNPANQEKKQDVTLLCRKGSSQELKGIHSREEQNKKGKKGEHAKPGRPDEPLLDAGQYIGSR